MRAKEGPKVALGYDMTRIALFSSDDAYRYTLERIWDTTKPRVLWVLLNPSTADYKIDDATSRRGVSFSASWGFGAMCFVNLFAYRATQPRDMIRASQPYGPENDSVILEEAALSSKIVCAWGTNGHHLGRDKAVLELLKGHDLWCLGKNKNGTPRHPLRLRADTPLERFA